MDLALSKKCIDSVRVLVRSRILPPGYSPEPVWKAIVRVHCRWMSQERKGEEKKEKGRALKLCITVPWTVLYALLFFKKNVQYKCSPCQTTMCRRHVNRVGFFFLIFFFFPSSSSSFFSPFFFLPFSLAAAARQNLWTPHSAMHQLQRRVQRCGRNFPLTSCFW